jgi:pimeloyl-ACP methyl ester carboxylesterase
LDLASGHRNGLELFHFGLLKVHGDLNEALRLETLFDPPADSPGALDHARIVRYRVKGLGVAGRIPMPVGGQTVDIETFQAGRLDGPPVVFLHGLGASKVSLLPALGGLAERHRVIAMDFPGFGKSGAPLGAPYDAAYLSRAVLGTLDAAGIDRAAFVGNSMGGRVALEIALAHPRRVTALGLLCPAVAFDEYRMLRPMLNLVRLHVPVGAAPWPTWGTVPRRMLDAGLRAMFADPSRVPTANLAAAREDFLRSIADPRRRMALLACTRRIGMEVPKRFWARLQGLEVPSLFVFGDTDRLVSPSYARLVERSVPAAEVEVWESCGHVPQFEYPVETSDRLNEFFTGIGA